jgi:hypothetical protein
LPDFHCRDRWVANRLSDCAVAYPAPAGNISNARPADFSGHTGTGRRLA